MMYSKCLPYSNDVSGSVLSDNFTDCQTSHKQQLWQCSQATSDKTWERSSCGEMRSSISMSMPCLPISSTSGEPTHILPFLFLGSQHDALSEDVIKVSSVALSFVQMECIAG